MSTLILFAIAVGGFIFVKANSGKDGRLPSMSTPQGKRTRIIGAFLGLILLVVLSANIASDRANSGLFIPIMEVLLAPAVITLRWLNSRKK